MSGILQIMPYYGLFSSDFHIRDHPCAHYFLWILPLYALLLCSMAHYDTTMALDIARDAPLLTLLGTSIVMPQWIMMLLCT